MYDSFLSPGTRHQNNVCLLIPTGSTGYESLVTSTHTRKEFPWTSAECRHKHTSIHRNNSLSLPPVPKTSQPQGLVLTHTTSAVGGALYPTSQ